MTPDAADAPYFFAARTVASEQNADPNVRVRLLLGAIAERPGDAAVRRLLFLAALESRQYHVALAANRRADGVDATDVETAAGMAEAHQQIAALVECPVGTVRSRIHAAKRLLRVEMEKQAIRKDVPR